MEQEQQQRLSRNVKLDGEKMRVFRYLQEKYWQGRRYVETSPYSTVGERFRMNSWAAEETQRLLVKFTDSQALSEVLVEQQQKQAERRVQEILAGGAATGVGEEEINSLQYVDWDELWNYVLMKYDDEIRIAVERFHGAANDPDDVEKVEDSSPKIVTFPSADPNPSAALHLQRSRSVSEIKGDAIGSYLQSTEDAMLTMERNNLVQLEAHEYAPSRVGIENASVSEPAGHVFSDNFLHSPMRESMMQYLRHSVTHPTFQEPNDGSPFHVLEHRKSLAWNRFHVKNEGERFGKIPNEDPYEKEYAELCRKRDREEEERKRKEKYTLPEKEAAKWKLRKFYNHVAPEKTDADIDAIIAHYGPPQGFQVMWVELYRKYYPGAFGAENEKKTKEDERKKAVVPSQPLEKFRRPTVNPQNPQVYLDVEIAGGDGGGKIVFELFDDVCPKTAENFKCLCTGGRGRIPSVSASKNEKGEDSTSTNNKQAKEQQSAEDLEQPFLLSLRSSIFHRIIPGFMCQGGDFTNGDGTGGYSIYGPSFADESFRGKAGHHFGFGTLSMANRGPDTNSSQFFICTGPSPWLDKKHVVFGQLLKGLDVVKVMEEVGTAGSGKTKKVVRIVDCGIWEKRFLHSEFEDIEKEEKEKIRQLEEEEKEKTKKAEDSLHHIIGEHNEEEEEDEEAVPLRSILAVDDPTTKNDEFISPLLEADPLQQQHRLNEKGELRNEGGGRSNLSVPNIDNNIDDDDDIENLDASVPDDPEAIKEKWFSRFLSFYQLCVPEEVRKSPWHIREAMGRYPQGYQQMWDQLVAKYGNSLLADPSQQLIFAPMTGGDSQKNRTTSSADALSSFSSAAMMSPNNFSFGGSFASSGQDYFGEFPDELMTVPTFTAKAAMLLSGGFDFTVYQACLSPQEQHIIHEALQLDLQDNMQEVLSQMKARAETIFIDDPLVKVEQALQNMMENNELMTMGAEGKKQQQNRTALLIQRKTLQKHCSILKNPRFQRAKKETIKTLLFRELMQVKPFLRGTLVQVTFLLPKDKQIMQLFTKALIQKVERGQFLLKRLRQVHLALTKVPAVNLFVRGAAIFGGYMTPQFFEDVARARYETAVPSEQRRMRKLAKERSKNQLRMQVDGALGEIEEHYHTKKNTSRKHPHHSKSKETSTLRSMFHNEGDNELRNVTSGTTTTQRHVDLWNPSAVEFFDYASGTTTQSINNHEEVKRKSFANQEKEKEDGVDKGGGFDPTSPLQRFRPEALDSGSSSSESDGNSSIHSDDSLEARLRKKRQKNEKLKMESFTTEKSFLDWVWDIPTTKTRDGCDEAKILPTPSHSRGGEMNDNKKNEVVNGIHFLATRSLVTSSPPFNSISRKENPLQQRQQAHDTPSWAGQQGGPTGSSSSPCTNNKIYFSSVNATMQNVAPVSVAAVKKEKPEGSNPIVPIAVQDRQELNETWRRLLRR